MNGEQFLKALIRAEAVATAPTSTSAKDWTDHMTGCLLRLAKGANLHLCGKPLGTLAPKDIATDHEKREYLFDFTLYEKWDAYSLPAVIVEHENSWSETEFLRDMWKVLVGFAPLRVMIGYAKDDDGIDKLVAAVNREAASWSYPASGVEDLVLLRSPASPTWRVLRRADGEREWMEL